MVAGSVQPPRLDLTNEDLVRSHVHAIWLAIRERTDPSCGEPPDFTRQLGVADAHNWFVVSEEGVLTPALGGILLLQRLASPQAQDASTRIGSVLWGE